MKFKLVDVVSRSIDIEIDYFPLLERNFNPNTGMSTWTTIMGDDYVLDEGQLIELSAEGVAWLKVPGQPDREAIFKAGKPVNASYLVTRGIQPAN